MAVATLPEARGVVAPPQPPALRAGRTRFVVAAVAAGALLPLQHTVNGELLRASGSAVLTGAVSYIGGALAVAGLLATGRFGPIIFGGLRRAPWWSYLGAVIGPWYIVLSAQFTAGHGAARATGLVLAGQVLTGMALDGFRTGAAPRPSRARHLMVVSLVVAVAFLLTGRGSPLAYLGAASAGAALAAGLFATDRLRRELGPPLLTTFVGFIIALGVIVVLAPVVPGPRVALPGGPWWLFVGGVAGAGYVTLSLTAATRLGLGTTTVAVVLGQVTVSLLIDPRAVQAQTVAAAVLLVGAVAILHTRSQAR
jgi:transporter family-2 protein